jgi:hypothetical protein
MIQALIRRMMGTRILEAKDCGGDSLYPEKTRIVEEAHCILRSLL